MKEVWGKELSGRAQRIGSTRGREGERAPEKTLGLVQQFGKLQENGNSNQSFSRNKERTRMLSKVPGDFPLWEIV